MRTDLTDTTSAEILAALARARPAVAPASGGRVLTLVTVTDEDGAHDALAAAGQASREFAARLVVLIARGPDGSHRHPADRLDAAIEVGRGAPGSGEAVVVRLHGSLARHARSVLLPLLLPEAPVVVWWPGEAPEAPARDRVGALAARRITDALQQPDPAGTLAALAAAWTPGDTDLAWTRITRWRFYLAAALDQAPGPVTAIELEAAPGDPSALLLEGWLAARLGAPVLRKDSGGPAVAAVRLHGPDGVTELLRGDAESQARLLVPGAPERRVALADRPVAELLREELRRLDHDPVYGAALRRGGVTTDLERSS